MPDAHNGPAGVPEDRPLREAARVALVHTPIATAATALGTVGLLFLARPYDVTVGTAVGTALIPGAIVALVMGVRMGERGVEYPAAVSGLVAVVSVGVSPFAVLALEDPPQNLWALPLLLASVPAVLTAMLIGTGVRTIGNRRLAAWGTAVAMIFVAHGGLRYAEAQQEQEEAAAGLAGYTSVAVLDAPGWRFTHAYGKSDFPELVYRDWIGRTVLLGSTPPAPDPEQGDMSADTVLSCGTDGAAPEVEECARRDGVLITRMRAAALDREHPDHVLQWPRGWREARVEFSEDRAARLRTAAPTVDLAELAGSIEERGIDDPEELVDEASCLLKCQNWRVYRG